MSEGTEVWVVTRYHGGTGDVDDSCPVGVSFTLEGAKAIAESHFSEYWNDRDEDSDDEGDDESWRNGWCEEWEPYLLEDKNGVKSYARETRLDPIWYSIERFTATA